MNRTISKSRFKPQALEYFRQVERTGKELIITDRGKPVLKIVPFSESLLGVNELRNTVLKYDEPTEPVGLDDWMILQ